jgi:LCP family protein required for cell wall assembly
VLNHMKKSFLILFLISSILSSACGQFLGQTEELQTPEYILVSAPSDATPTPTAFQPIPPTPGPEIPLMSDRTNAIRVKAVKPVVSSDSLSKDNPAWDKNIKQMEMFKQPENQMNIVLLGSDKRPYDNGYRTDVVILATINRTDKTINLTSFPRDLYVYQPEVISDRINTTFQNGGFELLVKTFEFNFGVTPDHYALINFDGFVKLIDEIGGIDVNVAKKLKDHRDKHGTFMVKPGINHMDGETALWYVRSRSTTNDFDRSRRQQEVIQAIVKKMLSIDMLTKIPQIYKQIKSTLITDMSLNEMLSLATLAPQYQNPDNFGRYVIDETYTTNWINPYGAAVLLPHQGQIRELMRQALNAE